MGQLKVKIYNTVRGMFVLKNPLAAIPLYLLKNRGISSLSLRNGIRCNIRKSSSDLDVFTQIFLDKEYDIEMPEAPKFIIDCGANIGLTTLCLKHRYPQAKIVAIEPERRNFEMLKLNTAHLTDIHLLQKGVWSTACRLRIVNSEGSYYGFKVEPCESGEIETVSISEIVKKFAPQRIDVLKIDIEGSEKELFANPDLYGEWLPLVDTLIIELHDRAERGCSRNLFKAIVEHNFDAEIRGENMVFRRYREN